MINILSLLKKLKNPFILGQAVPLKKIIIY